MLPKCQQRIEHGTKISLLKEEGFIPQGTKLSVIYPIIYDDDMFEMFQFY